MLLFLQILHFTSLTIRYHVLISLYSQFSYLALFSRILLNEKTNRRLSYNLACSQLTTALCLERQNWSAAISDAHARQPQSAASARRGAASARLADRLQSVSTAAAAAAAALSMRRGAQCRKYVVGRVVFSFKQQVFCPIFWVSEMYFSKILAKDMSLPFGVIKGVFPLNFPYIVHLKP